MHRHLLRRNADDDEPAGGRRRLRLRRDPERLYRLWDRDGDGKADGIKPGSLPAPFVRLDTPGDYPHNGLSGFAFDFAGNVYFGLGENLGADYRLIGSDGVTLSGGGEGGNIYRCRPDGSKLEQVATGFWNPFHMSFDVFGRLFAVDNDPDSRPPCRLLHIVQGGDYGYRFRNGRKGLHPFTSWNGELPGTLGMVAGTGEAPSGVVEYDRDNLPADYRGSLLVTSWGDHRIEQYRLKPHGASFRATMEPVVTGGEDFRPVGIAIAPDGSVFISDWVDKSYELHGKGRIWRLRQADKNVIARLDPAIPVAWRSDAIALAAAAGTGAVDGQLAASVLHHESADVRALGASILPTDRIDLKNVARSDPSPLVRAAAMRRLSDPGARDLFLKALGSDDPFVQQAARLGLRNSLKAAELVALAGSKDLSADERLGLLLTLRDSGRDRGHGGFAGLSGRPGSTHPIRGDSVGGRAWTQGIPPGFTSRARFKCRRAESVRGHAGGARETGREGTGSPGRNCRRRLRCGSSQGRANTRPGITASDSNASAEPSVSDARPF